MQILEIKRGSSLSHIYDIPAAYADGYFAEGWTLHSQVVDPVTGEVVADLDPQWVDSVTTRAVQVVEKDTVNWPEKLLMDVIFRRTSDGLIIPTDTVLIVTEQRVSRVMP